MLSFLFRSYLTFFYVSYYFSLQMFTAKNDFCSIISGEIYKIFPILYEKNCLFIDSSKSDLTIQIFQQECKNNLRSKWRLVKLPNNSYVIKSLANDKVLDVTANSTADDIPIIYYGYHSGDNQKFKIQNSKNGCKIINLNSLKCLEYKRMGNRNTSFGNLFQMDCYANDNQIFVFKKSEEK